MKKKNTYKVTASISTEIGSYPLPITLEVAAYGIGWISHEVEKALKVNLPIDGEIIKIEKIAWLSPQLWYIKDMKENTPQKGQLWAIGTKVYRVIRNEGDKTHAHHHGQMALFYTRHLKMATPSQVEEYLGK